MPGVEPGSMASEATTLSIVLHSRKPNGMKRPPARSVKPAVTPDPGAPTRNGAAQIRGSDGPAHDLEDLLLLNRLMKRPFDAVAGSGVERRA